MRTLSYASAINECLHQIMQSDNDAYLIGQGVKSPWYVGSTCNELVKRFGESRIIDTPVSECAVTGMAVGSALAGMRPIVVHPRMDFMYYAMDPIANHAANWHYMFGSNISVPITIWGIINRGGEQGAQHSQALHGLYAHIPGLKVVMPSDPYTAKGLLYASHLDNNPVLFVDERWLYNTKCEVPEDLYEIELGKGNIVREGDDITIVAVSYLVRDALLASEELAKLNINIEIIDPRTIKPLDKDIILNSVCKTGRLLVLDSGWKSFGFSSEVAGLIAESQCIRELKIPVQRLTLPDTPAPASIALEKEYFFSKNEIINKVKEMLSGV